MDEGGENARSNHPCYPHTHSFDANEALEFGFISKIFPEPAKVLEGALETAKFIAEKSPVAAIGTKYEPSEDSFDKEG